MYSSKIYGLLNNPELSLDDQTGGRNYGTFLFAEYLEERFAVSGDIDAYCLNDPVLLECSVVPDRSVIREGWEQIWQGHRVFDAMEIVVTARHSDLADVLQGFTRAMYLLAAQVGGQRVAGSLSDADAPGWRDHLQGTPNTNGDNTDPDAAGIADNRPRHDPVQLQTDRESESKRHVEPGGASYVELLLPVGAPAYHVAVSVDGIFPSTDVAVSIVAFKGYPEICAEVPVTMEPDSAPLIATAELVLPDECTMATVMLSHTNPLSWGSSDIIVRVSPEGVETDFAVASATGWGWTGSGYWERADWLPRGTVTAGRGQLPLTNGIAAERLTVYGDIGYTFLIAQLTDCQNAGALVVGPVRIGSDGVATSYLATPYEPPHLDPCRPFYVRFGETVRIWQATQVEPTEGGLALPGLTRVDPANVLTILATGANPSSSGWIDKLDIYVQGGG